MSLSIPGAGGAQIGITRDFLNPDGSPIWEGLAGTLRDRFPSARVDYLDEKTPVIRPDQLRDLDAIISFSVRYTAESFEGVERLVLLQRFGVGYDSIDLEACTNNDILVGITRGEAKRPVAESALTLMLAIGHQVLAKDRLLRTGRWHERSRFHGVELRDRVVGTVGLGEVGLELFRLLSPFGLRRAIATDPYANPQAALEAGVELVELDELLAESDFVSINCPLTTETRGMIAEPQLRMMKPTAFLVNTARGPVVDQAALVSALRSGTIRGAALDVFEVEPVPPGEPLLELDNVIVTPHAIAWTEELMRDYTNSCASAVEAVLSGRTPRHVVNRDAVDRPGVLEKIRRCSERHGRR